MEIISLFDPAPNISCTIPTIATPGVYTNTSGTVSADVGGSAITGNTASADLFVEPVPVFTKEFLDATTMASDPVVGAGEDIILEFTIENTSLTSGGTDIEFLDSLTTFLSFPVTISLPATPCGAGSSLSLVSCGTDCHALELTGGSLAASGMSGDDCTFQVTISLPNGLAQGIYTNTTEEITAIVDGATRTGLPASDDFILVEAPRLTKEFTDDPVDLGGTVNLEFTIEHDTLAIADATNISFTDDLSTVISGLVATGLPVSACGGTLSGSVGDSFLTYSGESLMPGETCIFSVSLSVPSSTTPGSHSNTTSNITADISGAGATGNPATDDLRITALTYSKEFIDDPTIAGDDVTLRFTINNPSAADATLIFFTDTLSTVLPGTPDLSILSPVSGTSVCGGTVSYLGSTITFSGGSLIAGNNCFFDMVLNVPIGTSDGFYNNVTTSFNYDLGGSSIVDDPVKDVLEVNSTVIQIEKEFIDDPVQPGDPVTVEYTLTNLDASLAISMIAFSNDFDAALSGLVFDSVLFDDCGGTPSGAATGAMTYTGGSLSAGGSCTIRLSLTTPVGATYGGTYTCTTSSVTGEATGGFAVTGTPASDDLQFQLLEFTKVFGGINMDGETSITFTITNPDPGNPVIGINFTDDLNAFISGAVATNLPLNDVCGNGTAVNGTSTISFINGSLDPLASCSFTVDVTVPTTTPDGTTYTNTTSNIGGSGAAGSVESEPAVGDLFIPANTFCSFLIICGNGTYLGSFDCTQSSSIPACPTNEAEAESSPYFMSIGDNPCGNIVVQCVDDITIYDVCTPLGQTVTRTITVFDDLNSNSTLDIGEDSENCIFTFDIVEDITPPVITCPADTTVECDDDNTSASTGTATATDDCDTNPTISESETSTQIADGTCTEFEYTITRTWTATDACSNLSTCIQTITVEDSTPPGISCPGDVTVDCDKDSSSANTGTATSTDDCDTNPTISESETTTQTSNGSSTDFEYTITRTWTATDVCLNSNTCVQIIEVQNTDVPSISCPADTTVECDDDNTSSSTGTATATGDCDTNPTITESDVSTQVTDGTCNEFEYVITRTWTATDANGNSTTCNQIITVEDTTDPVITCPADTTVECDADNTSDFTGTATATDNCDTNPSISETETSTQTSDGSCTDFTYTISRTWTATDACGNDITCLQTIEVEDTTDPVITCPADTTVECDADSSSGSNGVATATDNCDTNLTISESDISTQTADGSCSDFGYAIVRTWTATDACSNANSCDQVITVEDTTDPVITCPADTTVECDADSSSGSNGVATATDNCDTNLNISESDVSTQTSDGTCSDHTYVITRTWTASDACGNTSSCDQIINVEDTTDPNPVCNGITVTLDAGLGMYTFTSTDISAIGAGSSDNCDPDPVLTIDTPTVTCDDTPMTDITLTVTDDCNNSSTCVATIMILGGAPVIDAGLYGPVCEDAPDVILTGSPVPGAGETGVWSGAGVTDADNSDETALFDPSGLSRPIGLTYMFTNIYACDAMASTTIFVNDLPGCSASSNSPICDGFDLLLSESAGDAIAWDWEGPDGFTSNDQNPVIAAASLPAGGTYTVTVTDINGCTFICSTDVIVNPNPIIDVSDCVCAYDPNINNYGSMVTFSINNGTGPYTVSTSFGMLSNNLLVDDQLATLYLGMAGGNYTIDVVDINGCVISYISSCEDCFFDPTEITDPCSCNNDQSYNGSQDGTFGEVVDIPGPPGLNLIIGTGSTGINGYSVGDIIPEIIPGLYRLSFNHIDLIGYTVFVEGEVNGNTFPILDDSGNQLMASNVCQYPVISEPVIDVTAFCNNGSPYIFSGNEVFEINGFAGVVRVFVGDPSTGTGIAEFDPTEYANGFYTLTFEFTGTFIDNVSVGGVPAFPGCQTSTSIEVGVGGGGTLTCNDHVNVSVNNDCVLDFSWSTLLEDDYIPDVFDAIFTDSAGNVIDEADLGSYAGRTITYTIQDMCNGNSCWGTMQIDDKSIPEVQCDCPVGGEDLDGDGIVDGYSEDCTLTCWELPLLKERYWDRLRDDLVPEMADDFVDDNTTSVCGDITEDDVSYYDVYVDLGPCNGSLLRRTWTLAYDKGNGVEGTVSCTREYYFKTVGLETLDTARIDPATGAIVIAPDSLILPFPLVVMSCGADISPAGIASYFDDPGSVDQDTDDDNIDPDELDIDCVIESNEGVPFAYPHYYVEGRNPSGPHAQAINTEICNIIVGYTDNEIDACAPGCDGNRKVLRNWTVLDWCSGQFIEYGQIIKSIDTGNPSLVVHDLTVSVDSWKCAADVLLPHPEHIYDDCDDNLSYWIGNVEGALTVTGDASSGYVLHDVPEGETITVEYVTEDCCGNRGNAYANVTVVDLTPPVPVTKEFIVLSLTNIGNPVDEFQGIAKLFAVDVDNGSYDGCTGIDMAVRRVGDVCDLADLDWGDAVKFCCEDLDGQAFVEIDVEFRVRDAYGNTNYAWTTVRLEDKSAMTQTCPPDLVLTCDMDYNDGITKSIFGMWRNRYYV